MSSRSAYSSEKQAAPQRRSSVTSDDFPEWVEPGRSSALPSIRTAPACTACKLFILCTTAPSSALMVDSTASATVVDRATDLSFNTMWMQSAKGSKRISMAAGSGAGVQRRSGGKIYRSSISRISESKHSIRMRESKASNPMTKPPDFVIGKRVIHENGGR